MKKLERKLKSLPKNPGIYLFKDKTGEVLYVGKAKNLQSRVGSYFLKSQNHLPKTEIMLSQAADLDYTIVSSEKEALMLETTMIKKHRPPYNVLMRDDKNYQFFKIDYEVEIPQIYTVRNINDPSPRLSPSPPRLELGTRAGERRLRNKYYGPYTSGLSVRHTKKLINQIFQLCQNKKVTSKPCFAYHLKRCPGVCFGQISVAEYKKSFRQIEDFLRNKQTKVIRELNQQMQKASRKKNFEYAATLRDRLNSLKNIWEKQKVVSPTRENADYLGLFQTQDQAFISLLPVREGKLFSQKQFELKHNEATEEQILNRFISEYYAITSDLPKTVFLPFSMKQVSTFDLKTKVPIRGRKKQLIKLAQKNAKQNYNKSLAAFQKDQEAEKALEGLREVLKLQKSPSRIEGFDISNIQGTNPVGSMVVFTDGLSDRNQYRRFKIEGKNTPDDVGMMREILKRRFARSKSSNNQITNNKSQTNSLPTGDLPKGDKSQIQNFKNQNWPLPDLVVIDGGKAQLNTALKVLKAYSLKLEAVGLAKRLEEIYLPGEKEPLKLSKNSPALKLLQRIRDEAHRFAVTFHKKQRSRSQVSSKIDEISGIGPKTKKALIKGFGTISQIRNASIEDLSEVVGKTKARKIKEEL